MDTVIAAGSDPLLAGTRAESRHGLMQVAGRDAPFHCTEEPLAKKPLPVRASLELPLPSAALASVTPLRLGRGEVAATANGMAEEVAALGPGFAMVTSAVEGNAISEARMVAVSCVELTKPVVRSAPCHRTRELAVKLAPVTVSVKDRPLAVAVAGERPRTSGMPLPGITVKVTGGETPAALVTVMGADPAAATRLAGTVAVS